MASGNIELDASAPGEGHSYFIPMVDMLAGVVFILVILLAAATLVSRDEFVKTETSQSATAKAEADMQAALKMQAQAQQIMEQAKQIEKIYLDPRRQVEIATQTLLERLAESLTRQGYQVETNLTESRLSVLGSQAFAGDAANLSAKGEQLSRDIAAALGDELPCLTTRPAGLAQCAFYPQVRLETAEVQVVETPATGQTGDASLADARSLTMMSAIVGGQPGLIALRTPSGTSILSYAGDVKGGAGTGEEAVTLRFQMAVPAIRKD